VAIGLLTGNTRAGAFRKLQHYRIDHYFSFGGFGDDYACRNEVAGSALRSAAEHLGIQPDPQQTWVVGDTPNDIKCAQSIGANVIAVATGTFTQEELASHRPNACLADLSDWQRVVQLLLDED
jgi:phosphoglycolate phosphatase-like HAD superfamily hydrolase